MFNSCLKLKSVASQASCARVDNHLGFSIREYEDLESLEMAVKAISKHAFDAFQFEPGCNPVHDENLVCIFDQMTQLYGHQTLW
jgi:hypothetical protein